jgi:hypothetical protein
MVSHSTTQQMQLRLLRKSRGSLRCCQAVEVRLGQCKRFEGLQK